MTTSINLKDWTYQNNERLAQAYPDYNHIYGLTIETIQLLQDERYKRHEKLTGKFPTLKRIEKAVLNKYKGDTLCQSIIKRSVEHAYTEWDAYQKDRDVEDFPDYADFREYCPEDTQAYKDWEEEQEEDY